MTSRIIPDTINPKRFPGIQQKFSKLSASRSGARSEAKSGARSEAKSGARYQNKGKSSSRLLSSGKEERNKSIVNDNNNSSKPRSPRLRKFGKFFYCLDFFFDFMQGKKYGKRIYRVAQKSI